MHPRINWVARRSTITDHLADMVKGIWKRVLLPFYQKPRRLGVKVGFR